MLSAYLAGIGLGLALILPIGPQNLFVLNVGLAGGVPRLLTAIVATTSCDALLIALGTLGAGALLNAVPAARLTLLASGIVFLTYLGVRGVRSRPGQRLAAERVNRLPAQAAAVSLLNPHAIMDTVGVIGSAAAAQSAGQRPLFAVGAASASLVWFLVLGAGASAVRAKLNAAARGLIQRTSAVILLAFAAALLVELVTGMR